MNDHVDALLQKLCADALDGASDRDFLVLRDVAALQDSGRVPVPVNLLHLGVLFAINATERESIAGQFDIYAVSDFVHQCHMDEKTIEHNAPSYFKYVKEARCLLDLWDAIALDDGDVHSVATWLVNVLKQNARATGSFDEANEALDLATLDLLGRVLHLDDEWTTAFDDDDDRSANQAPGRHVPAAQVHTYVAHFLTGWLGQLERLGVVRHVDD
ncbi:Aste57867_21291 [Aphanomyces stellatus]|uniref:Aste57867_21291 protein n=1 Tax=Aphanomyces stellatus TaxID=120398 RepID=A0A485LHU0_9STRA|nr:hypothetical protein As57867_021222 [Aphanomyces stellatus]VFT97963.1 Aste57867_21291 [Aphanomyces stellatus]